MKKFTFIILAFLGCNFLHGQIATWNSTNGVGSTGVTAGTAVKGAGITIAAGTCTNNVLTNSAFFDSGDNGGEAEAVTQNEYLEFPITAQAGYNVTATSITFTCRHSPTGVNAFAAYKSNTTNLGSGSQATVDACESFTIDITDVVINPGVTVNFRLYGWGATNSGGNWRIAEVSFAGSAVLPIELLQFNANVLRYSTQLSFITATERDNAFFSIERSPNGHTYSEIGQVKGAGTSYEPQDYTFTDERPLPGKNYYRLRQVDYDGKYSYSPVVTASFGKLSLMTLAPTPATESLRIQLEKPTKEDGIYQVYDMNGRLLLSGQFMGETTEQVLNISGLPEGAYVLRLTLGQEVMVEQFRKNN